MKHINLYKSISFLVIFTLFTACLTKKEKAENLASINQAIAKNNFKFVPQQVMPQRASLIISPRLLQLDGTYYLKFKSDSLISYLPFFGESQQAEYGSRDTGLDFTTTDFSVEKKEIKNGGVLLTIIPNNQNRVRKLFLTISDSGTANLSVLSNNRDGISYSGVIEANN